MHVQYMDPAEWQGQHKPQVQAGMATVALIPQILIL